MAEGGVGISNATKPEYEALRKSYPTLVECIERSLGTTTDELYSLGVFSKDEVKSLRNDKISDTEKARKILNVVMSKVESEPSFIHEFICIMDIEAWMKPYTEALKGHLDVEDKSKLNSTSEHVAEVESGEATNTDLDTTDFTPAMDIYTYLNDDIESQFITKKQFDENNLEDWTKEIQDEFASVVTNIAMALKQNGITINALAFHLSELGSASVDNINVELTENLYYFSDDFVKQVVDESQDDVYKVIKLLRRYYSWINWGLIKSIKKTFLRHNEDIQTLWEEYQSHFKEYCKQRMCKIPKPINGTKILSKLLQKSNTVIFKIDANWHEIRFDRLNSIQASIKRLLGLESHTLYLKTVRNGCVELVFEVPQHVADVIFPPTEEQLQALQECNIKYCGEIEYLSG